jgi:hypothetical protein
VDALTERLARKAIEQRYRRLFRRHAHFLSETAGEGPDYLVCLRGAEQDELEELRETARRLDGGELGTCEACRRKLPPGRVQAAPWLRLCDRCSDDRLH